MISKAVATNAPKISTADTNVLQIVTLEYVLIRSYVNVKLSFRVNVKGLNGNFLVMPFGII